MKPTVHQYTLIALLLGGVAISGCSSTPSAEPVEEPVAQTEPAPVFVPVQKPTPEVTAVEAEPVLAVHKKTVYFEFDSAQLTEESRRELKQLITTAQKSDLENSRIVIQGHADAIGPEIYNDTLSRERAKSVESFLKANLDPEQWKVEGFGESQPIASNENPNGREQNRRVVVEYISSNKPLAMMQ